MTEVKRLLELLIDRSIYLSQLKISNATRKNEGIAFPPEDAAEVKSAMKAVIAAFDLEDKPFWARIERWTNE